MSNNDSKDRADQAIAQVIEHMNLSLPNLTLENEKGAISGEPDGVYVGEKTIAIEHTQYFSQEEANQDPVFWKKIQQDKILKQVNAALGPLLNPRNISIAIDLDAALHYFSYPYTKDKKLAAQIKQWNQRAISIIIDELTAVIATNPTFQSSVDWPQPTARPSNWLLAPEIKNGELVAKNDASDFLDFIWKEEIAQDVHQGFTSPHLFYDAIVMPGDAGVFQRTGVVWGGTPKLSRIDEIIAEKNGKIDAYKNVLKAKGLTVNEVWLVIDGSQFESATELVDYYGVPTLSPGQVNCGNFDAIFFVDCVRGHTLQIK